MMYNFIIPLFCFSLFFFPEKTMRFLTTIITVTNIDAASGAAATVATSLDPYQLHPGPKPPAVTVPLGGSIRKEPGSAMQLAIQDQKTLEEFLRYFGESESGQFGTDFVHKPTESLWTLMGEIVPAWLFPGVEKSGSDVTVHLDQVVYRAGPTAVFVIKENPILVMKYYAYCKDDFEPFDAIVVEASFMTLLEKFGIAARILFYSGYMDAVSTTLTGEPKIPNPTCGGNGSSKPQIRYMIMERLGMSWKDFMQSQPEGKIGFVTAIKIGATAIMLLQKLHEQNIVHGDAHMGNLVFAKPGEFKNLKLIDFGRSRIVDLFEQEVYKSNPSKFCSGKITLHPWMGKWEMKGCRPSFHDDVYRVVQGTAMSIHGMAHYNYLNRLITTNPEEYKRIKNSAEFWELSFMTLANGRVDRSKIDVIKEHLRAISRLASHDYPSDPHHKPNYEKILANFKAIIDILAPRFHIEEEP
jgi:hypothetical protein